MSFHEKPQIDNLSGDYKVIMNFDTKVQQLRTLNEMELRNKILIPLLNRMQFKHVTNNHGPSERGKDIICASVDQLGNPEYYAIVAKAVDLDGSAGSPNSVMEVVNQIEQCFDVPYEDVFGMRTLTIDRVWVVTSRKIVSGATNSIMSKLNKTNLAKLIRFITGNKLCELIDEYFPEYWDDSIEPIDRIREKNMRLQKFCGQLLLALGGNRENAYEVLTSVENSCFPPLVEIPHDRSLQQLSSYRVSLDMCTGKYTHPFFSHECGIINDHFIRTKNEVSYSTHYLYDFIETYNKFMEVTDPREFVINFEKDIYRSDYIQVDRHDVDYLESGLNDLDELFDKLSSINKLGWAENLVDSVLFLSDKIELFLEHATSDSIIIYLCFETNKIANVDMFFDPPENRKDLKVISVKVERLKETRNKNKTNATVKDVINIFQREIRNYLDELVEKN